MKLLTLTSRQNFQEIPKFISEKLTTKKDIVVWNYDHITRVWLEPDKDIAPAKVLGTGRYEDSVARSLPVVLNQYFPFEIINLDFSSQNPPLEDGRIEKEILSIEYTIYHQKASNPKGFVLIYTTIIDGNNLNSTTIVDNSNRLTISGWSGLSSEELNQSITDCDGKLECIETVLQQICLKYGYEVEFKKIKRKIPGEENYICSIAGTFKMR